MEKKVLSTFLILFIEIPPSLEIFSLSIINPDGSIIAEIPLFADLRVYLPYSTDLKMLWAKCWYGPIELPNQPSSDILTIKL